MIHGVGIDLLDFTQVDVANDKLTTKILTDSELKLFARQQTSQQRMEFFAGRFAAKEAYVKALGTGFRAISFRDIEVLNEENGRPQLTCRAEHCAAFTAHVSISHSASAATAIVVLEKEERN